MVHNCILNLRGGLGRIIGLAKNKNVGVENDEKSGKSLEETVVRRMVIRISKECRLH